LPSPKEFNPIIDAESGEDPNAPRVETQQPIENRGVDPRFMIQGNGPRIDLSGFFPERANKSFDPNKAIGGENVPYQPTGFFRGLMGDPANRKNIEAQLAQGAEWKADARSEKERKNKREDLDYEIAARAKEPARQFDAEQKRLADKAIQDEIKGYEDEAVKLASQGNEDVLRDADMVRKEAAAIEEGKRKDRELDIRERAIKPPRYSPIGNTGMFQTPEGDLAVFEPEVMRISDKMPGRPAKFRMLTGEGSKPPGRSVGDVEVNRADGSTLGGPLVAPTRSGISLDGALGEPPELPPGGGVRMGGPLPAPPQNTALVPRFMQGAGDVMGGAMTYATDPLRYAGKEMYKQLFNSGAQQDPEVLKRLKKREEESSPWDIQ
jgi:hypothetical protein